MKYVFFGSPRFAAIVLQKLIDAQLAPIAVVGNPDRPVGRKQIMTAPLTKDIALKNNIPVLQPEKLDESFQASLNALNADFFVVAAYAKIIPSAVLSIPRLGTLGVHPSLLPKYRGASPIQSVLLDGEATTGVTIYQMDAKMDHGPILNSMTTPINPLTTPYDVLEKTLAELSAETLIATLPDLISQKIVPATQDESLATYTKKFTTEDGRVDEAKLTAAEQGDRVAAEKIIRMINAFATEPGCWTIYENKRIKLLEAEMQNGSLRITRLQEEGGKPKTVSSL